MTTFSFGGGGKSASFKQLGDHVAGTVLDMQEVQQTEYKPDGSIGKPLTWDDGNPRMQYKITLQTDQRDPQSPGDDGKRDLYVKGSRQPRPDGTMGSLAAVLAAITTAGAGTELQYGAKLTMQWTSGAGVTGDPKGYTAWYEPPSFPMQQPPTAVQPAVQPQPLDPPQGYAAPPAPPVAALQQPVQVAQQPQIPGIAPAVAAANPYASNPAAPIPPLPGTPPAPPGIGQQYNGVAQVPGMQPPPAPAAAPATPAAPGITREAIAGLRAAGVDPTVVYGPGWEQRVSA